MNNITNENNNGTSDGRSNDDRKAATIDVQGFINGSGPCADEDLKMAESSTKPTDTTESMADTSSSTSEEVMSGTQSDQTANISSNGGYSGDYESISDSSSGASKKRKVTLKISGKRRRDITEEEKEEKSAESRDMVLSQNHNSSLAPENGNGNIMSVEFDKIHHHHHHNHNESDGKHQTANSSKIGNSHRHHHYHYDKDRPNEARDKQVNRQINEIMKLYNVSLQAQANAQEALQRNTDANGGKTEADTSTINNDTSTPHDSNRDEIRKQKVHHHYQVQSNEHPRLAFEPARHNGSDLPGQLDGFPLMEPSNPKIDLVRLYRASESAAAGFDRTLKVDPNGREGGTKSNEQQEVSNDNTCYNNLMKACRPFFQDSKTIMEGRKEPLLPTATTNQSHAGSDEAQSSSGFTSFFTTTKSDSNTNAGEGSSSQSEFSQNNKKKQEEKADGGHEQSKDSLNKPRGLQEELSQPVNSPHERDAYQSDSSSLVVLARMKRKYKDYRRSEGKKQVRIETVALDAATYRSIKTSQQQSNNKQPESSSFSSGLSTSVNSSESSKRVKTICSATHSDSAENSNKQTARTVTDNSRNNTTNNSSGSGTGSGIDVDQNNKSESGSQMEGVSNSDDKSHPKCVKDSMSETNIVAAVYGDEAKKAQTSQEPNKPLIHHHSHDRKKSSVMHHTPQDIFEPTMEEQEQPVIYNSASITKEEKLMEKKRKRMSARKEYEEDLQRQLRDSSESSSKPSGIAGVEPGKPVTLEDVLSFSKTARMLVQALPPFLAVHTNAAFTLLTGNDSHTIIGQPLSSIITISKGTPPNKESDSSSSDMTNNKGDTLSSLSGSLEGNKGQNDANMANTRRKNTQDQNQSTNESNTEMNAPSAPMSHVFRIDRLIVARGYGHIHNVEVKTLEPCTSAHVIEGSEVNIDDGKSDVKRKKKDHKIFCRMSVCPVVTNTESWEKNMEGRTDSKDHNSTNGNKRRKHHNGCAAVKHYLIQLESIDGPCLLAKRSSFSSSTDTTVEAQLLGMTRSELIARRCKIKSNQWATTVVAAPTGDRSGNNLPETDSQDDNTSVIEPVATCG